MLADPIGEVNVDKSPTETRNPVCRAVRRLRVDLGDTQQQFANRLGLAISTVVRYEISRPPHGKALAQLERLAMEKEIDQLDAVQRAVCGSRFHDTGVAPNSQNSTQDSLTSKLQKNIDNCEAALKGR